MRMESTDYIAFEIPGEPQGKGRARVVHMHGRTMAFTPDKTVLYENLIKTIAQSEMIRQGLDMTLEPVKMVVDAYYTIPKSASKKKHLQMISGEIRPCKKPDVDNIIKAVADSLNGIVYKDDTQIVEITASKHYSENPEVVVHICRMGVG